MFRNYLKIAWRNIRKNKLHSLINITGLALAFSIFTLLFSVAYFQLNYDSFHHDDSRIYKITTLTNSPQGMRPGTQTPLPLGPALHDEILAVEEAVRVQMGIPEKITHGEVSIERMVTRTDPNFFDVFNFPAVQGDAATALSDLQNIVLSQRTANALFGQDDPVGQQVQVGKEGEEKTFTVSAVVSDCPRNSSIRYEGIVRIESYSDYAYNKGRWDNNFISTFIKTVPNTDQQAMNEELASFVEKHYAGQLAQLKADMPDVENNQDLISIHLTNIRDVHFSGPRSTPLLLIYAILGLGVFILLIACFNFVNLNLAYAFQRSSELGIRKTLGAYKRQIFMQLWGEVLILYFVGFLIGLVIAWRSAPWFNSVFDTNLDLSIMLEPRFLLLLSVVFLVVTLIAGGYPALKMTHFNLVDVLKGNVSAQKPGTLRNTLLISQFSISVLLISVSVIAGQQLNHLRSAPIGFDKEQVVSIPVGFSEDGSGILSKMRNELASDPMFGSVTGTSSNLGRGRDRVTSRSIIDVEYNQNRIQADWLKADYDYFKTLEIPVVQGRGFNREYPSDAENAVVVTESFVKAIGEKNPVGKYFGGEDERSGNQIIGVVPDFLAHSPTERSLPIVIKMAGGDDIKYLFVKVLSKKPQLAMERLKSIWEKATTNAVFKGSFLDENLQAWYEGERAMTRIFGMSSVIAILLSCLGLFAISLMVIELRRKEIGIRKVMGASVKEIVGMISWHFVKLVLISLVVALPIAWLVMQRWITNYEYRMDINPLVFVAIGGVVICITLITVGFHSIKAALANPAVSLQDE